MLKNADMKSEPKNAAGKERCTTCRLQEMGLCILIQPEHTQIAMLFQEVLSVFSAYNSMRENAPGPIGPITCFKSILTVMTLLYIEDNIIHLPLQNRLNIARWSDPAKTAQEDVMLSGHDTVRLCNCRAA